MDAEHIKELFASFGPVNVRRMFSGAGIFVDGMMMALVVRDVIYLKADAETIPAFEQEGLSPFSYATRDGTRQLTSYWRMPDRLYDDPDELAVWARQSLAVARRKAERTKPKKAVTRKGASRTVAKRKTVKRKADRPRAVSPKAVRRKSVRPLAASRSKRPRGRSRT